MIKPQMVNLPTLQIHSHFSFFLLFLPWLIQWFICQSNLIINHSTKTVDTCDQFELHTTNDVFTSYILPNPQIWPLGGRILSRL